MSVTLAVPVFGACLLVSRRCCLSRPQWYQVLVSMFAGPLHRISRGAYVMLSFV